MFDVPSCQEAANQSRLDDWVHQYLLGGPWANAGLSEGLRRQRRYWIGPLEAPLGALRRCCGPEASMEYQIPAESWAGKVSKIAEGLVEREALPPLIVEWRAGALSVRDGNHRLAAMHEAGWRSAWIIVWCNSVSDYAAALVALAPAKAGV